MYKNSTRGFTLIELLVVIAIIGILASVVLAGLSSQRDRARQASAISSARSVVPVATACIDANGTIQDPAAGTGGGLICNAGNITDTWPDITTTNWTYGNPANASGEDFTYTVTDGAITSTCSITGCTQPS